jgi:hypothetical protein
VSFCKKKIAHAELELELIQTQMAQKPMLRVEVYARALRASQNVKRAEVWVGARCDLWVGGACAVGLIRSWKGHVLIRYTARLKLG